jgi:hypothetical protein
MLHATRRSRAPTPAWPTPSSSTGPASSTAISDRPAGGELLDRLFARGDAPAWFARVLREPVTPAVIRGWLARDAAPQPSGG